MAETVDGEELVFSMNLAAVGGAGDRLARALRNDFGLQVLGPAGKADEYDRTPDPTWPVAT